MTDEELAAIEARANAATVAVDDWQVEPAEVLALVAEARRLRALVAPKPKSRFCKHCPFAEFLHDGHGSPDGCPGFEAEP